MGLFTFFQESEVTTSIYDFKIQALHSDEEIDFADFKGKKILIVNVASRCGFTPQYKGLEKLNDEYGDELVVIGFPCNQFMFQESGSEEKIAAFCQKNYGVSFPMTTKVKVKGRSKHPIYKWLKKETKIEPDWNFNKFLVDKRGRVKRYAPAQISPMKMANDIQKLVSNQEITGPLIMHDTHHEEL